MKRRPPAKKAPVFNVAAAESLTPEAEAAFMDVASNGSNAALETYYQKFGDRLNALRDDQGRTALIRASETGRSGAVELMLRHGADINAADNKGNSALMIVARLGFRSMTAFLLDRGAALDARNHNGQTPLALAVTHKNNKDGRHLMSRNKKDTVFLLLERGAKLDPEDKAGYTAETWARRNGYDAMADAIAREGIVRAARQAADVAVFTQGIPEDLALRPRYKLKPPGPS